VRFSVWPNPERSTSEILDLARYADESGWYGFWFADHYMPNTGTEEIKPGDVQECWAVLPAVAAVTERVRLGPLVAPTSIHHPALLANRAATIDQLSNGRFVLGLGAGWQINEHKAYGFELEPPKQRVDRFEEAIQITRSLLDNDRTTFDGVHYQLADAPADPKPVQDKLPIIVGTGGPRMCRITARHAQEWNTWGAPDMAAGARETFDKACAAVDVDPASLHTSVQAMLFLTDDADQIEAVKSGPMGERSIAGSAGHLVDEIGRYGELGFDEVIVPDFNLGSDQQARRDGYDRLSAEVLDQLG
jgi:alkanesulfonate monooxygenase SsuD/methylene tetrahydromethanopterin reductase-like flavin-dependent oxidoreductase (luciferase family)